MKKPRLLRRKKHHANKIGLPPGALVYVGDAEAKNLDKPKISKIIYDANGLVECELSIDELANYKLDDTKKIWLNVHGVHDAVLIKQVGDLFHLHPLVLEDILNTEQRPKIDEFDDYVFLETRLFYYHQDSMSVSSEQISMVLGHNFLLTFQERSTGAFEPIRERLRATRAPIRDLGVDYLAYALLDGVVDRYFSVLEDVGEASEALEEALLLKPTNAELHSIHPVSYTHLDVYKRQAEWRLILRGSRLPH